MKQFIFRNGSFLTLDKKFPSMKALLITDGVITASADEFILREIAPDAKIIDMKGGFMVPGFLETYSRIIDRARLCMEAHHIDDMKEALRRVCGIYFQHGITTATNVRTTRDELELLYAADKAGLIDIDIDVYLNKGATNPLPSRMPVDTPYKGHIRLTGVSIQVDTFLTEKKLTEIFTENIKNHWQSAVEADSEEAIDKIISSYRSALITLNGSKTDEDGCEKPRIFEDLRPLICGGAHIAAHQLTALQALGFTPCFNLDYMYTHGAFLGNLTQAETVNIYPARSIVRRGMAFSLQHDLSYDATPDSMSHPNMLRSICTAVNRTSASGQIIGSEQSINSDQALNAVSLFAAYQLFEDSKKGSLTPSKIADLVVLNKNPLELSDSGLGSLRIYMTVKDGNVVYRKL